MWLLKNVLKIIVCDFLFITCIACIMSMTPCPNWPCREQLSTAQRGALFWAELLSDALFLFTPVAHFESAATYEDRLITEVEIRSYMIPPPFTIRRRREIAWKFPTCCWLYCKSFPVNRRIITILNVCFLFKKYKRRKTASITHPSFKWLRLQSDLECTADRYVVCLHAVI